jgi:hypothetical protein
MLSTRLCFFLAVIFFALLMTLCVMPPAQVQGAEPWEALLREDSRLHIEVSVSGKWISLSSVVNKIGQATGVPLSMTPRVQKLPVTINVVRLPANEMIRLIAHLYDLNVVRWGDDGYWLGQKDTTGKPPRPIDLAQHLALERSLEREKIAFLDSLMTQSRLTDDEVTSLAVKFPTVSKMLDGSKAALIGARLLTWLSDKEVEKMLTSPEGITISRDRILQSGGDLDTSFEEMVIGLNKHDGRMVFAGFRTLPNGYREVKSIKF